MFTVASNFFIIIYFPMWKIQESNDHELWFLKKKTVMPWKDVPGTEAHWKMKVKKWKGKS